MSPTVPCNYCGVDDATEVFGPGVAQPSRIVRCNRCGLMYANPRAREPDAVLIQQWEPDRASLKRTDSRFEKERLQVRDFAGTRMLLNRAYPARGKLLEIGSGLGFLLAEFKKDGWDVFGLEPNRLLSMYAAEELGVAGTNELLHEAGIPDEAFDVVIMNHVIEHLEDPLATLSEINRVLKTDGHLVLETPRYDTLMFRLLGRRERSLSCEGHIYFFTTQTLRSFYEAAGFETRQLDYVGRSLTVDRLLWNVGVVSKSARFQTTLTSASRKLGLNKVHLYLNLGDMQRVCVRKVRREDRPRAVKLAAGIGGSDAD
jgi:SAM-dependent methyltransferase